MINHVSDHSTSWPIFYGCPTMLCGFIAWYWPNPLIFLSQFPHLQRERWIISVSFLTRFLRGSNDMMETNIYGRDYQWSTSIHPFSPLSLAITPQAPAKHTAQPETTVPSLCCSWIWPNTPLLAPQCNTKRNSICSPQAMSLKIAACPTFPFLSSCNWEVGLGGGKLSLTLEDGGSTK